jgi:hypothetical protein
LRDIAEGLQRAQKRDQFNLEQRLAVRPRDIQRAMLLWATIIHFSGHGEGEQGLVFEDDIAMPSWSMGLPWQDCLNSLPIKSIVWC